MERDVLKEQDDKTRQGSNVWEHEDSRYTLAGEELIIEDENEKDVLYLDNISRVRLKRSIDWWGILIGCGLGVILFLIVRMIIADSNPNAISLFGVFMISLAVMLFITYGRFGGDYIVMVCSTGSCSTPIKLSESDMRDFMAKLENRINAIKSKK